MDKFTASNGAQIVLTNARQTGYVLVEKEDDVASAYLGFEEMVAWREFFHAERDAKLGVWRSDADPTWTALRRNNVVYFHNEDHERGFHDANRDEVWLFKSEGRGHALAWRAEDGWDVIDQRGNYHKGIEDVPAEMVAHSFYGWENATAVRLLPEAS